MKRLWIVLTLALLVTASACGSAQEPVAEEPAPPSEEAEPLTQAPADGWETPTSRRTWTPYPAPA